MSDSILGSIFGFGNRLRDSIRNPSEALHTIASALEENRSDSKAVFGDGFAGKRKLSEKELLDRDIEQGMGFINPVPLGTMGNFLLRKKIEDVATNMSRRDFMKKSAGIAAGSTVGAGVTAKLLRKFAPEERAVVREAVAEAAPKYKYNSLKEYLDDVRASGDEFVDLTAGEGKQVDFMKQRLLQDEMLYKIEKQRLDTALKTGMKDEQAYKDYLRMGRHEDKLDTLNAFSPQAKKEMKEFKSWSDVAYDGDWALGATKEFPR